MFCSIRNIVIIIIVVLVVTRVQWRTATTLPLNVHFRYFFWRHPVLVLSLIVFGRVLRFEATALICVRESAERGCRSSCGGSCWTKYGSLGRINNGTGTGNRTFLESRISYQLGRRKNAGNLGDGWCCRSCCCCGRRWIELGIVMASQTWKYIEITLVSGAATVHKCWWGCAYKKYHQWGPPGLQVYCNVFWICISITSVVCVDLNFNPKCSFVRKIEVKRSKQIESIQMPKPAHFI